MSPHAAGPAEPLVGVPGALALGVRRISGRNPFTVAAGALGLAISGGLETGRRPEQPPTAQARRG